MGHAGEPPGLCLPYYPPVYNSTFSLRLHRKQEKVAQIFFLKGSYNHIRFCASLPLYELGLGSWIICGNESDVGPIFQNVKNLFVCNHTYERKQ